VTTGHIACRALVFDMDGLMVDSEPLWFRVERDFARARGGDWTEELAHACVGTGIAHTLRSMEQAFGFAADLERDADAIVSAFVDRVGELSLKGGCGELLDEARSRDIPCAVASSSAWRLVEATLARFGLRQRFRAVVTGSCVARPKPAPDIFLEAARRLGSMPGDCVALEDSLAGVVAARAAGMRAIAVPERAPERFAGMADAVVADLHQAREILGMARP
jgi:beta-phosphoglucomutase-like phosphatase (HAD superfamily)